MSAILKEVRALKKGAEAAKWVAAENSVLNKLNSLNNYEFSGVVQHFGEQQQGSTKLWEQLDVQTRSNIGNFNVEEIQSIFHGFGNATYEPSKELSNSLVNCYFGLGDYLLAQKKEQDPYYESDQVKKIMGSIPEHFQRYLNQISGDQETYINNNQFSLIGDFNPEVSSDHRIEFTEQDKKDLEEWKQQVESRIQKEGKSRIEIDQVFKL